MAIHGQGLRTFITLDQRKVINSRGEEHLTLLTFFSSIILRHSPLGETQSMAFVFLPCSFAIFGVMSKFSKGKSTNVVILFVDEPLVCRNLFRWMTSTSGTDHNPIRLTTLNYILKVNRHIWELCHCTRKVKPGKTSQKSTITYIITLLVVEQVLKVSLPLYRMLAG